jgi:hypothetical protein
VITAHPDDVEFSAAVRVHESQHEDHEALSNMMTVWAQAIGRQHGLGDGRAGEAFVVVDTG